MMTFDQTIRFSKEFSFIVNLVGSEEANICSSCRIFDSENLNMVLPCLDLLCDKCYFESKSHCKICNDEINEILKIKNL